MKNKGLIIVIVLLLIYGVVMFILFGNRENIDILNNQEPNSSEIDKNLNYYLVLDDKSYKYDTNNGELYRISNSVIEEQDKLNVYANNKFLGKYNMKYVANWNLFNDKKEFVSYEGNIVAANDSFKLNVKDINIREINDQDKVFLINRYNVSSFSYLTTNEAVDIDLDNNGEMDEIICLSSKEYSNNDNNYFDIVMVKLNGNVYDIINKKGNSANVYNIMSVFNYLDKKQDSIYLIKTAGIYSDEPTYENVVINYVNNNYSID